MSGAIYFDFDDKKLDRAQKLLAGIPDGIYRAVGSAIKRAAQHGLTVGMRIVSEEYAIGQDQLKSNTRHINTIVKDGKGSFEVTFGYRGNVIPLIRFDTQVGKDGNVSARVLRSNAKKALEHAFIANVGGHRGIFERESESRLPIKEIYGPSAVQAFYAREETVDKMDEEIRKTYEDRIEHEITRVMNGWGGR
jgi:hypothetical protein